MFYISHILGVTRSVHRETYGYHKFPDCPFEHMPCSLTPVILDQTGGKTLLRRGDFLCNRGMGCERAQAPYISQTELLQIAGSPA